MKSKFKLEDELLKKFGIGYVPDKRYNENFKEQGLTCPYEHCIETMPLHEDEEKEAVKKGMIIDLRNDPAFEIMDKDRIREIPKEKPEIYNKIRKVLDKEGITDEECWFYPDLNSYVEKYGYSSKACRLYGHECPGGEKQVKECKLE